MTRSSRPGPPEGRAATPGRRPWPHLESEEALAQARREAGDPGGPAVRDGEKAAAESAVARPGRPGRLQGMRPRGTARARQVPERERGPPARLGRASRRRRQHGADGLQERPEGPALAPNGLHPEPRPGQALDPRRVRPQPEIRSRAIGYGRQARLRGSEKRFTSTLWQFRPRKLCVTI